MAANRSNPIHEATIQATWILHELGRELRLARIAAGMSQAQVAAGLGWSQARVSLAERGCYPAATVQDHACHAAAVRMRIWIKVFPGGRHLVDAPQLALLERLRARIHASWGWELEVPVPREGDLRAGDCRLSGPGCTVLVEAITRLSDAQAQVRAAQAKRRDLHADRLILLITDSGANRRALREAGPILRSAFPMTPRAALRALADGRDPGADAIILL